jgi:hypothetical protein
MMVLNLKANIIDIEIEFLHDDLEEIIFMEIPSGIKVGNGKCLVLKKTIYGMCIVLENFVKLVKALNSCEFTGILVDPCLWVKKSNTGTVMMVIYLDDCLGIGSDEDIKEVIEDLKKHEFVLKIEE